MKNENSLVEIVAATKHDYCITRNDEKGLVIESTVIQLV